MIWDSTSVRYAAHGLMPEKDVTVNMKKVLPPTKAMQDHQVTNNVLMCL